MRATEAASGPATPARGEKPTRGQLEDGATPELGKRMSPRIARSRPWAYFALAYAFSWFILLPAAAGAQGLLPVEVPAALLLLGGFGPFLAAVVLTAQDHGSA